MAHLLGIREVIVDLLVHDVENHIQKIPARQGQLRNFTYKIFLQKKAWKVYKKTYHMKKKKPVRIAGYLSKNPSGATFASLLRAPSQAEKAKKKKSISPEADTGESDRVGTEETDLTRRNRFPRSERKRRRGKAGESPSSTARPRAAARGGVASPIWGSRPRSRRRSAEPRRTKRRRFPWEMVCGGRGGLRMWWRVIALATPWLLGEWE